MQTRRSTRRVLPLGVVLCIAGAWGPAAATERSPATTEPPSTAPARSPSTTSALSAAHVPGEVIVRSRPGTSSARRASVHARLGARLLRRTDAIGADLVALPGSLPVASAVSRYRALGLDAEPNYRGRIALQPDDACPGTGACAGVPQQWHLAMTNAFGAWDRIPGRTFDAAAKRAAPAVTVAVLDTKVDASHPDFANPGSTSDARTGGQLDLERARDWIPSSRWGGAAAYHGTFVAGLVAASAGNGRDVAGIGYAARVLPLTVVDGAGNTDAAALADAIVYAWEAGARVINLSLGILGDSAAVRDAIRLVTRGTTATPPSLVVAAAGNNTGSAPFYPGSYPESLSVSGTDAHDRRAPCSNHNANVSVAAPADRLAGLTVMPTARFQAACGTSAAAPQVSGLAALLFLQDPARTPAQVRQIIERSADDVAAPGRDDDTGWGRINAERALASASAPVVRDAAASVAPATGGSVTVTATATGATVRAARVTFGSPSGPGFAMQASDGAFGSATEALRVTFALPAGTQAGAHPIWIRAFDGTTWGAATVVAAGVDGKAPTIRDATASTGARAAGTPMIVTFSLTDDYAVDGFAYVVEFTASATGARAYTAYRPSVRFGAQRLEWSPPLTAAPGHYTVKVVAADPSGNTASTLIGAVLT